MVARGEMLGMALVMTRIAQWRTLFMAIAEEGGGAGAKAVRVVGQEQKQKEKE